MQIHWGGDLGGSKDAPHRPKRLHFQAIFGKNLPNNRLAHPWISTPPLANPGSPLKFHIRFLFRLVGTSLGM